MSLTSMVPSAPGTGIVRTMVLFWKSQTRIEARTTGGPGTTFRVVTGLTKSLVTMRLTSGRTEMPCGLKPSGGLSGHSCTRFRCASNSATRPGAPKSPAATAFTDLATKGGVDPKATYAPESYDAAFLLALAIQKKGSNTRDGLSAAVRAVTAPGGMVIMPGEWDKAVKALAAGQAIKYQGASGTLDFDKAGDVPGTIIEMTVKNGAFTEVGPAI